jgi:hypothetical protein
MHCLACTPVTSSPFIIRVRHATMSVHPNHFNRMWAAALLMLLKVMVMACATVAAVWRALELGRCVKAWCIECATCLGGQGIPPHSRPWWQRVFASCCAAPNFASVGCTLPCAAVAPAPGRVGGLMATRRIVMRHCPRLMRCDVVTFYSPEAVIMTSEDFAPQREAMHQSSASNVIFHPQSQPAVAAALPCV